MIEVWIDGACEPAYNNIAGYGLVVKRETAYLLKESMIIGKGETMSNNVAEYSALLAFLEWYKINGKNEQTIVYSDSMLLVNQMMGQWKSKEGLYKHYFEAAQKIIRAYEYIDFQWIAREENEEADALSKKLINESK